ncbi:MAG: SAM-dependent methyltransferase [Prevotellaceae bacterium]|nr:SAM-dependent methyltransferase [Prevotellaceae bacterium]
MMQKQTRSDIVLKEKRNEYGDWQTSLSLAISICEHIKSQGIRPQVIVEPTCGQGNFIVAALLTFDTIEDVYGIEIYKPYLDILKDNLLKFGKSLDNVNVHLYHENIFDFDFGRITEHIKGKIVLAIGNPPWVTNSKLCEIGSANLPVKTNFKRLKGLEAITGKGNFDIAEYICIKLIEKFSAENVYFAFLLKNSVIKNIVYEQKAGQASLSGISQYNIDAQREFDVSVAAALLIMRLFGGRERSCRVFDFYTKSMLYRFGWTDDKFVADLDNYIKTQVIDGVSPFVWRSGLKHDCSKVMELSKENGQYFNALGEIVDIEDDVIYPLIKSSDVKGEVIKQSRKYVIVTQHSTKEDTIQMKEKYPKAYKYLTSHADYLDNRKSSIYKNRPRFCMFGIGDYSFKKYKVIISGLYKQTSFSMASEIDGKIAVCDDTCYMLGFDDYDVARLTLSILNSQPVQDFIRSICFYDAKRAINKELLMRINLLSAISLQNWQTLKLTKDVYEKAAKHIALHSNAVMAQQTIDFEAVRAEFPNEKANHKEDADSLSL